MLTEVITMDKHQIIEKIAAALLIDYSSVYYINAITNQYQWFSVDSKTHSLKSEEDGDDFFETIRNDAQKHVHEEDRHLFLEGMKKEKLLSDIKRGEMHSIEYRLMIDGKPVYHTIRLIRGKEEDSDYFILGVIDIDKQVKERQENEKIQKERILYNKIAESLASNYDVVYYVDISSGEYSQFTSRTIFGELIVQDNGSDFFGDSKRNAEQIVHPEDKQRLMEVLDKSYLVSALKERKQFSVFYRLIVDGTDQYTKLTALWSSDRVHLIIGVENVDEEIRRENQQKQQLNDAKEFARKDGLTGVKNKLAYTELEASVQENLDKGLDYLPFAIAVCDLNDLKAVNDTLGHNVGDDYIKTSCSFICEVFDHSPVFRIGGDEFVVFIRGNDYENRKALTEKFKQQIIHNMKNHDGPIIAIGVAEYVKGEDFQVSDVLEKADIMMYENKKELKQMH